MHLAQWAGYELRRVHCPHDIVNEVASMPIFRGTPINERCCSVTALLLLGMLSASVGIAAPLDGIDLVESSTNCFSGSYDSHESWRKQLYLDAHGHPRYEQANFERSRPKARFEAYKEGLECHYFVYKVDAIEVEGFYVASKKPSGPLPTIIINRGGVGHYGSIDFGLLYAEFFPLVEAGFTVIGSNLRGGSKSLAVAEAVDEYGGEDVNDVLALFDIIEQLPNADINRVGMFSGSRGAITAFKALREGAQVRAAVFQAPAVDLLGGLKLRPEMNDTYLRHIPGYLENKEAALRDRSVLYWVDRLPIDVPLLIGMGQFDSQTDPASGLQLALQLQARGHPYRLIVYEIDDHHLSRNRTEWRATYQAWLKAHLQ